MTDYQKKNNELMHYGVLGMKWGHHKAKVVTSSKKNSKKKSNTDIKKSVKEYSRKYDNAEKASNIADKKWHEVDKMYISLGKNKVERIFNAAHNKTDAAKRYNKAYDEASNMSDKADELWRDAKNSYKKTGRNKIERVINNAKYS